MSDTVDNVLENVQESVDESVNDEMVVEEVQPVEQEDDESDIPSEEEAPVEEAPVEEAPVEEAPVEEAPVEEAPVEEAPVEEAPVEEAPVEEAPVEEAPVEEAPVEEAPVPQPVPEPEPMIENNNLCSLKTLVDVLGKWSGGEIRRKHVENLLKENSDVDENLDDLEKVIEILKLWIDEGGTTFREHNHFKNIDEYTLLGESRNLSEEEKLVILKTLTDLTIDVSQRKKTDEEIKNIINNL
jgi:hypothetical protein